MSDAHEIYIGDKVDRAMDIIAEETGNYELEMKATSEIDHTVELRGNYLRVELQH